MAKLTIKAKPTFEASVGVPVAGGASAPVRMTFKHRTKSELAEFVKTRGDKSDTDSFLDMVEGWDMDEDFTRENVEQFLENYIGAAVETFRTYVDELTKAREKN